MRKARTHHSKINKVEWNGKMIPIVPFVGIGLVLPLTNLASTHSQLKKKEYMNNI